MPRRPKYLPAVLVKAFTKVEGYEQVSGAPRLPSIQAWRDALQRGGAPPGDRALNLIATYLGTYWQERDDWDQLALLGQLYFLTDNWLKAAGVNSHLAAQSAVQKAVLKLFGAVVNELCKCIACSVNRLPQMLESIWGRVMTPDGRRTDGWTGVSPGQTPTVAKYLSRAEAEKYRLIFDDLGRAQQLTWWNGKPPWELRLANSAPWRGAAAPGFREMNVGFAGYVLSMGREFYMTRHRNGFKDGKDFYHSSYLAGDPVLCAGTIEIVNGRVLTVTNESGHFRPTVHHLLEVVQALQMHGVTPASFEVSAMRGSWDPKPGQSGQGSLVLRGDRFLHEYWRGKNLQARIDNNEGNRNRPWTG
jgi:hypothetical protein